jgi:dihydropteroate synthase
MRTLVRPTAFVDSPFGKDGKVARLAGGLNWFSAVELLTIDASKRIASKIVTVQEFQDRLDDDLAKTWERLTSPRPPLELGSRTIRLDQPQVMGIVNATPDSFSDGGRFADAGEAAAAGAKMSEAGAAIIDVGGESTRPGAQAVWEGDEIERIVPVIRQLASGGAAVSVDSRKADVMTAAIEAGASLVNDVSALSYDSRSAGIVAAAKVPVVLMHHQGSPESMQDRPHYEDVVVEVYRWLEERIAAAQAAGIERSHILIDIGFGFGKSVAHNLDLANNLALFHGMGCPILFGASRKRTIGALSNEAPTDRRLAGSLALALKAVEQGVQLVRVHDVEETVQALKLWRGLRDQALTTRS